MPNQLQCKIGRGGIWKLKILLKVAVVILFIFMVIYFMVQLSFLQKGCLTPPPPQNFFKLVVDWVQSATQVCMF